VLGVEVLLKIWAPQGRWEAFHKVLPSNGVLSLEERQEQWRPGGIVVEGDVVAPGSESGEEG
jgi:hypothetical protein